ncbi:MAG: T9SS type A sorting domain-containing protein [Cytophagaceae bacterium]
MERLILLVLFSSVFYFKAWSQHDLHVKLVGTYAAINDNASYRWEVNPYHDKPNYITTDYKVTCLKGDGGRGWYPQDYTFPVIRSLNTHKVKVELFGFRKRCVPGGKRINGVECTYEGTCKCNDGGVTYHCSGSDDEDIGYYLMDMVYGHLAPGVWHTIELISLDGGRFGVRFQIMFTPSPPTSISFLNLYTNSGSDYKVCMGNKVRLTATGAYPATGDYVWEWSLDGRPWVTFTSGPSTIEISLPSNASGNPIAIRFRVFSRNFQTRSVTARTLNQTIFSYPPPPYLTHNNIAITEPLCNGTHTGKIKVSKLSGTLSVKFTLQGITHPDIILNSIHQEPLFPDDADNRPHNIIGLPAGVYRLSAENQIEESGICRTTIDISIPQPAPVDLALSDRSKYFGDYNISCFQQSNGSISLQASGGNPPYQFLLSRQSTFTSPMLSANGIFSNLNAGQYFAKTIDKNGCENILGNPISLTQPDAITCEVYPYDVKCNGADNGEIIFLNTKGGTPPYQYFADNGHGYYGEGIITNLPPGDYYTLIIDANNCSYEESVSISEPEEIAATIEVLSENSCYGEQNGSLTVSVSGGVPGYKYSVNGSDYQPSNQFFELSGGEQHVAIKDANECVLHETVNIYQPDSIAVQFDVSHVQCSGFDNGTVNATIRGGVPGYNLLWNTGSTDSSIANLSPGNYLLTVTDNNRCSVTRTVTVTEPENDLSVSVAEKHDAFCNTICSGKVVLEVNGGTRPYAYHWLHDEAVTDSLAEDLCSGIYRIAINDDRNCIAVANVEIKDNIIIPVVLPEKAVLCPGQSVEFDAGNPGCAYHWSSDNGYNNYFRYARIDKAGKYVLKVTNQYGCYTIDTFLVDVTSDLLKARFLLPSLSSIWDTIVFTELSYPEPDSVRWDFGLSAVRLNKDDQSPKICFNKEGTYSIKLTAYLGECVDSIVKQITLFIPPDNNAGQSSLVGVNKIKDLKLYPNPNDGYFKVDLSLDKEETIHFSIFNYQGHLVMHKTEEGRNDYSIPFHMFSYGKGVYLMKIQTAGDYRTVGFVVE